MASAAVLPNAHSAWRSFSRSGAWPGPRSDRITRTASGSTPQTAALRALRERLDARSAAARRVRLLSISVDPLGDSPAALRDYARRFDLRLGLAAGWLLLTGSAGELARTWRAFDVPVADPDAHSSLLWLGDARTARWTRASALAPTERLLELMRQVAA